MEPDFSDQASVDAPINVSLAPAKRTAYTATAYFSTDTGPGIRLGVDRRWVNKRGHKLGASVDYRPAPAAVGASYTIPLPGHARPQPQLRRHVSR